MTNFFDLDRPRITGSESFRVAPAAGGGLFPFASALSRLLVQKAAEGLFQLQIRLDGNSAFGNVFPGETAKTAWVEVAGSAYLREALTGEQEKGLRELGWNEPKGTVEEGLANWWREFPQDELDSAALALCTTLAEIYGFSESAEWTVDVGPFS